MSTYQQMGVKTSSPEHILHTEYLELLFGPVTAHVHEHTKARRVIDIVDELGVSRTHAVTFFPKEASTTPTIQVLLKDIEAGKLIGKAAKEHGFQIKKNVLMGKYFKPLPQWLKKSFQSESDTSFIKIYDLFFVKSETEELYGTTCEIFHPDLPNYMEESSTTSPVWEELKLYLL